MKTTALSIMWVMKAMERQASRTVRDEEDADREARGGGRRWGGVALAAALPLVVLVVGLVLVAAI